MDSLEQVFKLISDIKIVDFHLLSFAKGRLAGILSKEEYDVQIKSIFDRHHNLLSELKGTSDSIAKLVYSFEYKELYAYYRVFADVLHIMLFNKTEIVPKEMMDESAIAHEREVWEQLARSAGQLQKVLRDKLISIRDT